jgi:hypothetical protein
MSLFARLKSVFGGAPAPRVDPPARAATSSVPQVNKPVIQEAVTDQKSIRLARQTTKIAPGIVCNEFDGTGSQITALPDDFVAHHRLKLRQCKGLTDLPTELSVPSIDLSDCTALRQLPAKMHVTFLNLSGCEGITALPDDFQIAGGILNLSGCTGITTLPDNMGEVAGLNLNGCHGITALPDGLKVTSWMDITGTGITEIPEAYAGVGFRNGNKVINAEKALAG